MVTVEVNNPEVSETGTAMNWRLDEQTVMSVELELDNFEVVESLYNLKIIQQSVSTRDWDCDEVDAIGVPGYELV